MTTPISACGIRRGMFALSFLFACAPSSAQLTGQLPPPWHPAAGLWSVTVGTPFGPMKAMMCTDGQAAPDPLGGEQDARNQWRAATCRFEPPASSGNTQVYRGTCRLKSGTTHDITITDEGDFKQRYRRVEKLIVKAGSMAPNELVTINDGTRVGDCGSRGNRLKPGQYQAIDGGEPQSMKVVRP